MSFAQAERGDEAVDRLPHRAAPLAELTIVVCGSCRQFDAASLEDLEAPQVTQDADGVLVGRESLKDLAVSSPPAPRTSMKRYTRAFW